MNQKALWLIATATTVAIVAPVAIAGNSDAESKVTGIDFLRAALRAKGIRLTSAQVRELLANPTGALAQALAIQAKIPFSTVSELAATGNTSLTVGQLTEAAVEVRLGVALTDAQKETLVKNIDSGKVKIVDTLGEANALVSAPANNPIVAGTLNGVTRKG